MPTPPRQNYFDLVKSCIYLPLIWPHILIYLLNSKYHPIQQDFDGWKTQFGITVQSPFLLLIVLLTKFMDFRNLYYYRIKNITKDSGRFFIRRCAIGFLLIISQFLLPKLKTLTLNGRIGGGLVLVHAHYGVICPDCMGENCKIWHEVTIGYRHYKAPRIGDFVEISPGAKIFGDISIGDRTKIGPNAIVMENIGPNKIVVSQRGFTIETKSENQIK